MLYKIKSQGTSLVCLLFSLCVHCTHTDKSASIEIDKPLIQNLTSAQPQLQNLKYSLVRLHLQNDKQESSFGTAFFFQTRELLVTTLHTFDENFCAERAWCSVKIGFAKNEKEVEEVTIEARVALRDRERDLLFLEVKNNTKISQVRPLQKARSTPKQRLISAGFFQDGTSLTFSHGHNLKKDHDVNVTTMIVGRGFSGAPVVNEAGELVGVVSSYHPLEQSKDVGIARYVELSALQP